MVFNPDAAGLEVSTNTQIANGLEVFHGYEGIEVISHGPAIVIGDRMETLGGENELITRRRIPWFIIAAMIFLPVVATAVLGGVLGSRYNHSAVTISNATATTSSNSSSTIPSTPSSTPPSPVYAGTSIGVTGWWTGTFSFSIRLLYQGEDSYLRLMQYNSGDGNWSTMDTLTTLDAKLGSPIAISCFNGTFFFDSAVTSTDNYTQIEIFYINNAGNLQEWYYREQELPSAQTSNGNGTMSTNGWKAGVSSRLAAYWPSVIFQDDSDQIQEAYYANLGWTQKALGLKCQNHSAFIEVPYSINAGREGGEKFIYQRDDQKLFIEERTQSTANLNANGPAITIPPKTAISAFSVLQTSNLTDAVMNTYILWQDSASALQMTWMENNGWRTTSPSVGSPDNGTGIACLTPTIWSATPLQPKYSMARCYYLVNRQIREIQFDGSNWSVVGNVQLG